MLRTVFSASKLRVRPAVAALRAVAPVRMMSAKAAAPASADKEKLRASFPYAWPWGQEIEVKTGKHTLKIRIPQDAPAPRQAKLAYKLDAAPPEIPPHETIFTGPIGKAAHQLFNNALKTNSLDTVQNALQTFAATYEIKREFKIALMSPLVSAEDKVKTIKELAAQVGADELTTNVLVDLHNEKRYSKLFELGRYYNQLLREHRKERHGVVTSAEPLSEKHFDAIYAKMQKLVAPGEKLIVEREVDPSLVGGFTIRIGGRAQDLSVAGQIDRMENHLTNFFIKNKAAVEKVLV